jgi:hypothetical protein
MYADGLIGNRGIIEILGSLTAGHFNSMLPKGKTPYNLQAIIPNIYDYLYPPLSEETKRNQVSDQLLAFAMLAPNAPKGFFKGK